MKKRNKVILGIVSATISAVIITSIIFAPLPICINSSEYTYQIPENINDGIEVGSLNEVNIDSSLIEKAMKEILCGIYTEVHSILIFRDNKLVFEEYFTGHKWQYDGPNHHGELVTWTKYTTHNILSDTKSITSACIGIAIDLGFIESVNQSIFNYLPDHQHLKIDGKEKITIEHLLTMTAGLEWPEWSADYSSLDNPEIDIWYSEKDPISYILEKPLIAEPGTYFQYSGGNMKVLGEILRNATNMTIDDFSKKYLFEPLKIDSTYWTERFENGVINAAGGLYLTPRAMTKIGVTFLNMGVWNESRIISDHWVEKCATPYPSNTGIDIPGEDSGILGYSYSWWMKQYSISSMFSASGFGGQHIMVLPEINTVVVFTGGNYVTYRPPFKILEEYILPSIE